MSGGMTTIYPFPTTPEKLSDCLTSIERMKWLEKRGLITNRTVNFTASPDPPHELPCIQRMSEAYRRMNQ